jgi:hypothetical protein
MENGVYFVFAQSPFHAGLVTDVAADYSGVFDQAGPDQLALGDPVS